MTEQQPTPDPFANVKLDERRKLLFDFFKHLTTLNITGTVIVAGLYGVLFKVGPKVDTDILVFGAFFVGLLFSLRAMIVIIQADDEALKAFISKKWSQSMKLALTAFFCASVLSALGIATAASKIAKQIEAAEQKQQAANAEAAAKAKADADAMLQKAVQMADDRKAK